MRERRVLIGAAALVATALLAACGPGGGDSATPATLDPIVVTVPVGGRTTFTLSPAQSATWTVEGVTGGSTTVGRITAIGVYTAPFVIPSPSTVTIGASAATNTATVNIVSRFVSGITQSIGCSTSCTPNAVSAPDLNGDGLSDLVTANAANGTLSVVMRGSASAFFAPVASPVGTSLTAEPQALVAGDFNGGSDLDLVIADADTAAAAVWIRLGLGDGTFPSESSTGLGSGTNPLSMASGRFDADGNLDVVVANFLTPSSLSILRGDGTGAFLAPTTITAGVDSPLGVAVADFNKDTYDDIAVANSGDDTVAVFLSVGDGTFETEQTYTVAGGPSAVVATDLNGDGFPDLAVTAATARHVVMIINRVASAVAGTTFNQPSTPYATGVQPIALAAANINRDGFQDLAVVNQGDNTVTVFLGYGDGTVVASETYPVGSAPQSVAVGDFNGDGWPDLAVANSGDDTVTILRNRGT
jgi:hypothetical protein